jgi:hypothetical protein
MSKLVNVWIDEKQGWGVVVTEDDAQKRSLKMVQKAETKDIKPQENKDAKSSKMANAPDTEQKPKTKKQVK